MTDRAAVAVNAIREMREIEERPGNLSDALRRSSKRKDLETDISVSEFIAWLELDSGNQFVRQAFHTMISGWDYGPTFIWSVGTEPSTRERRDLIYTGLELSQAERLEIDRSIPVYPKVDQPISIKAVGPEVESWYTADRRAHSFFYWKGYESYLSEEKRWDPKNIAVLDWTSTEVVSDIADPLANDGRSTKGLVVGYVQSGKTANFTGVIAKAIDAGYRLVIVLAGMQNSLRNQTQRRIDKELVGAEVLEISGEYENDDDWPQFKKHGTIPSRGGGFDIDRLTTSSQDFENPIGDLSRLRFHKKDASLPFNHPKNLVHHPVKLIVVKKNVTPLKNLLNALKQSARAGTPLSEVPSIIIDDESDQASLNSKKPTTAQRQERTAINGLIVSILGTLKRGQYVGYTATPYANVFVNPDDAEDLFPSDFILSLPRPDGYMGVQDFYDDPDTSDKYPDPSTNYGAHVRPVKGDDATLSNLPGALDAFVLSGAVKLYRQAAGSKTYRHHTMLVHLTTGVEDHKSLKALVDRMFSDAGYSIRGPGFKRLKTMWEKDFAPISAKRGHADGPIPASFEELKHHIGKCVSLITRDGGCSLILNGKAKENPPDFDKSSVWKIIIGGAKLSRGYTVEGLTVSYYRRKAGAADTLMQMGRWFGYRDGYRDLVRLYIGTHEPKGADDHVNLYEAFRGVCLDEEEFRGQLSMYSRLTGEERLTPSQVPPLVPSHMLMPTATNKMYNAELKFLNFGGQQKQSTIASGDGGIRLSNEKAMKKLLAKSSASLAELSVKGAQQNISFRAFSGIASSSDMTEFLDTYSFGKKPEDQGQLPLIREFLKGKEGDPAIDRWVIIAPQPTKLAQEKRWRVPGVGDLSIRERSRDGEGRRYKVFTESRHVTVAQMIAGTSVDWKPADRRTSSLTEPRTAVMLFYPVLAESEKGTPTMGFSLHFPKNQIPKRIRYGVKVKSRPNDVTVEVTSNHSRSAKRR